MLKYALIAAALMLAPATVSAATVAASLTGVNDLSSYDYTDTYDVNSKDFKTFTLTFVVSDAPRLVTATLNYVGEVLPTASIGFSTGDSFTIPGVASLPALGGPVTINNQVITFLVSTTDQFTFTFAPAADPTVSTKGNDIYYLTVTSSVPSAAIPLPAALPMLLAGLGVFGIAARLRKA